MTINKEVDEYFRITPHDVDADDDQNDVLANIEKGLNEQQLKALKL